MADFRRRIWTARSRPTTAPRLIDEEITPSSGWTQSPDIHCLLVDLPGFEKDEIKLNVDESGSIVVSGRRRIGAEKQVHFEKSFSVPEDGDIKRMSTIFQGDTLKVSVPKVVKKIKEEPLKTNGASISSSNAKEEKWEDPEKPALNSSNDTKEEEEEKEKRKVDQNQVIASSSENKQEKFEYGDESPGSSSDIKPEKKEATDSLNASSRDAKGEEEKKEEIEGPASSYYTQEQEQEHEQEQQQEPNKKNPSSDNDIIKEEKKELTPHQQHTERNETSTQQGEKEKSSHTSVVVKIIDNKAILIASILSFTLGVFLSQKFHSPPPS
ncbi:17.6 kDa class II heat shock protein [Bienertia sinuspersici]